MPVYEYECQKCNRTFEVEQRISEPALKECPECHGQLRRLIAAGTGFIMKNSGRPATGHRPPSPGECSFEQTGITCCGRGQRCDEPGCGSGD